MKSKSQVRFPSALLAMSCTILLSSCTNKSETPSTTSTTTETTTSTASGSTTTDTKSANGNATGSSTGTGTQTGTDGKTDDYKPEQLGSTPEERKAISEVDGLQKQIKLDSMPDSMVICTVSQTPITVGEYRHFLKQQAEQLQAQIGIDPDLRDSLIKEAQNQHVSLTDTEKKKLLDTAAKAEKATKGTISKLLQQDHEDQATFQKNLLNLGLAFKFGTQRIEAHLLQQIVDREMLCSAGRANGFGSKAYQAYIEKKEKNEFQTLTKDAHLSEAEVKDEFVKDELVRRMITKIQQDSTLTDSQIKLWYDQHKNELKHGDIIRLSQIVIASPTSDVPPLESVRTQIKRQNPTITKEQLDKEVASTEKAQKQKAQDLLDKVKGGADFTKLANENTDDMQTRAAKLGGDMGWKEKKDLIPQFADKVWTLKVGELFPSVIESPFGFHVVKITGKEGAGIFPLDEVKPQLKESLQVSHSQEAVAKWFADKRKVSNIVVSKEFEDAAKLGPNARKD